MKYMQWQVLKILPLFIIATILSPLSAESQTSSFRLRQADSLFSAKQYTQSLELYQTMFEQHQYTSAMLLKMAYIEEGLGETGKALYHLNLYYHASNDKSALDKMEELANKYNLVGYGPADRSWALSIYHDYHAAITLALCLILFLLAGLGIFLKRKGRRQIAIGIVMILFVAITTVHVNAGAAVNTSIVVNPRTMLMSGPSAGATVVATLSAGHRIEVVGRRDVWIQVLWAEHLYYIKEGSILPISL